MEGVGGRKLFACEPKLAPPPTRIVEGRNPRKNVLILLEEKTGARKSEKRRIFFYGARERSERRRGGSALVRMFVKVGSDFNQKVPPLVILGFDPRMTRGGEGEIGTQCCAKRSSDVPERLD